MLKIKILTVLVIALSCFMVPAGFTDELQMRETLTRIEHLLNQINPLINLAESQQDHDTRVQFQFETLRQDLSKIQFGIDQALQRVSIQPRVVDPLSGDYLPISTTSDKVTDKNTLLQEDESS